MKGSKNIDIPDTGGVRAIAMYLPQYHPIPENDAWWGKGFTEWTNVRKGTPRFQGHYQPHVPGELGYYDLRTPDARIEQAELAKRSGIFGFCYYHYWFNGRRLLERPLNEVIASKEPRFPFCVCWANENWTRRWDGRDRDVLMAQQYSDDDSLAFILDLLPAFRDERYIRVNGRPLLIIYRTSLLPDPKKTAEIWRETMIKAGVGEIYLVRVENFMHGSEPDPAEIGFDAAMEFAPYWESTGRKITNLARAGLPDIPLPDDLSVYDYERCMLEMMSRFQPAYTLFRGVFPAWDNTARRSTKSTLFVNSSPENFAFWLSRTVRQTCERYTGDERLVFINAWNEWGEGCHLEPDEKYGRQYLDAVGMVLRQNEDHARLMEMRRSLHGMCTLSVGQWYEDMLDIYRDGRRLTKRDLRLLNAFNTLEDVASGDEEVVNRREQELLREKDEFINTLLNSSSWKVTKPMRKVMDTLRKLPGRNQ
ncbi:MAG TPA: glycoside hydrolase family 99-like domain-containing protein [Desulfuromonadales bacterium]|nr:glycoside hydrolase family 99-like domain-containing protein [Desulfuromonadales bacterium]